MKKKIKYILFGSVIAFLVPTITNAATLTLDKNKEITGNKAEYSVKYTKSEKDTEDTIEFQIETSSDKVKIDVKKKLNKGTCTSEQCTIPLSEAEGDIVGVPIEVATITLENNESVDIEPKLQLKMNGTIVASDNTLTLTAGLVETPKSNNPNITDVKFSVSTALLDKTFNQDVTEYVVTGIKDTINSITIDTTCENCKITVTCPTGGCSVSNTNRVALQAGVNQVAINSTSEDGTSNKTYIFNIYRGDVITSSPYLEKLQIKDATLSPSFDSLVNDYSVNVKNNITKLDITAIAEDPSANIEIKGNENFTEGENTVTITVTSSDGENKQVYTILVTREKEEKKVTKKVATTKVTKKKKNYWLIILLGILAVGLIVVLYLLLFKRKKSKKKHDKNNKNDKNNKKEEEIIVQEENDDPTKEISEIEKENTDALQILEETTKQMKEEPKQDIDEALDDLMKTKKLELGDLDF